MAMWSQYSDEECPVPAREAIANPSSTDQARRTPSADIVGSLNLGL